MLLIFLLQLSGPVAPSQADATPMQVEDVRPEPPKIICTMEPVTGTRARKQKICRTPGYEKGAERSRDMISGIQRASNGQPPAQPGIRPGGPGF
jgi:hypothetical protein